MILTISEVVSSICSEGKFAGYPTTYVTLQGCNLKCTYCSKYKNTKRKRMSVQTILNGIFKMGNERVIITGGEPLLQETIFVLVYDLVDRGYQVLIETNGSLQLEETLYKRSYNYSVGVKCPSSGMSDKNNFKNLDKLMAQDEVKFIIKDIEDYAFAKEVIKAHGTKASFVFVPLMTEKGIARQLSQWLLEDKLPKARISIPTGGESYV